MSPTSWWFDSTTKTWRAPGREPLNALAPVSSDWSEANPPWAYDDASQFTQSWPAGVRVVNLLTTSFDFYTNLAATVANAGGRCVVRLPAGVFSLKSFRLIGSSGDPTYAFGFWFPNLQGLLGAGPDKTFVQMDANSMTQAQLDKMATFAAADFAPSQIGMCRLDGTAASPVLLAGLTFRAADQQMMTSVGAGVPSAVPQPAPHNGVIIYPGSHAKVSYVRFQAAARALTSAPPFECGNAGTQYGTTYWDHCEFDGRRSPALDPARPRRCGVLLINNETFSEMKDCWFHHSNVSRYAANDENRETRGIYRVIRCKAEQITNNQNTDPALNGGQSLRGFTNATPFGWESCNGTIEVTDCIVSQDNSVSTGQVPMHLQLTSVGSRNPQGGRLTVNGGEFRNTGWPWLDGFVGFRIKASTYWWLDGFDTTLNVNHKNGQRLAPFVVTGTWPPTAAALASAGVTPSTHYLVRAA